MSSAWTLSVTEARRFCLWCSGLQPKSAAKGLPGTAEVIRHLGYVQIDTISVVERAHHHVLWSRVPNYQTKHLVNLEEQRRIFEYWSHAASYLPMEDYRYALPHMLHVREQEGHWYKKEPAVMRRLLERITTEGPLMSRDFDKLEEHEGPRHPLKGTPLQPQSAMDKSWVGDPVKRALRQLFMEGRLMVSSRQGFQKTYDLPEKVLPPGVDTSVPSRAEYLDYLVDRYARTYGLFTAAMVKYLLPVTATEVQSILNRRVEQGQLKKIFIKGWDIGRNYFIHVESFERWTQESFRARMHVLSPFDNFLIQRSRMLDLYNFNYTLECYVPSEKRKVGYFSLPVIYGDKFIAQADLKADRPRSTLVLQNLVWEDKVKPTDKHRGLLQKKLQDYAAFNGCEYLEINKL